MQTAVSADSVGILGIGTHLPDHVRTNDWWPAHVVETWQQKRAPGFQRTDREHELKMTEGMQRTLDAMARHQDDPFQGAQERRIIADDQTAADMEAAAAKDALAAAGVRGDEVDFVIGFSICPDDIQVPGACVVHERLGLKDGCLSFNVDAVCNSFQTQLTIAAGLIRGGFGRRGLLLQSSSISRLTRPQDQFGVFFGDGATAVVVGPVTDGKGLLGASHHTNGKLSSGLVCGVPGGAWHDPGAVVTYTKDGFQARQIVLNLADLAAEVVPEALLRSSLTLDDVDFYACHQATPWLREVTQAHIGFDDVKSVDTFPFAGTLSAANLPMVLATADREGLLDDGDVIAMFSGGTGITWSGSVLRWGH